MPKKRSRKRSDSSSESEEVEEDIVERKPHQHIVFFSAVNQKSRCKLQRYLTQIQEELKKQFPNVDPNAFEITLHICSKGGNFHESLVLYDLLRLCTIPVKGIVEGQADSGASLILLGCHKRQMTASSRILIHQISMNLGETTDTKFRDEIKNQDMDMNRMREIYLEHTRLSKKFLDKALKHDIYWNAKQCLEFGLVDEVL